MLDNTVKTTRKMKEEYDEHLLQVMLSYGNDSQTSLSEVVNLDIQRL